MLPICSHFPSLLAKVGFHSRLAVLQTDMSVYKHERLS